MVVNSIGGWASDGDTPLGRLCDRWTKLGVLLSSSSSSSSTGSIRRVWCRTSNAEAGGDRQTLGLVSWSPSFLGRLRFHWLFACCPVFCWRCPLLGVLITAGAFITRDKNRSDTDGYYRYHICFHVFGRIWIRICIRSTISDKIRLDVNIINIRFKYSDTVMVSDIEHSDSDTDRSEPL